MHEETVAQLGELGFARNEALPYWEGGSWGNSWGVSVAVEGGGGPSKKKRRKRGQGWARERELLEQSLRKPEPEIVPVAVEASPAPEPDYSGEFIGVEQIRADLEALQAQIEAKRIEAERVNDSRIQAALRDEQEAMTVILLALEHEYKAFQMALNI